MPYELFWHGPLSAFFQYRAAYLIKEKEKTEEQNRVAWLNGVYISQAVASVLSEKSKYPDEPIKQKRRLTPEEQEKAEKMNAAIVEHNEKMRKLKEQKLIEFQQKLLGKGGDESV